MKIKPKKDKKQTNKKKTPNQNQTKNKNKKTPDFWIYLLHWNQLCFWQHSGCPTVVLLKFWDEPASLPVLSGTHTRAWCLDHFLCPWCYLGCTPRGPFSSPFSWSLYCLKSAFSLSWMTLPFLLPSSPSASSMHKSRHKVSWLDIFWYASFAHELKCKYLSLAHKASCHATWTLWKIFI